MDANEDIKKLLVKIRNTLRSNLEGKIDLKSTSNEYRILSEEYFSLEKEIIRNNSSGFIEGILYHHNIINFSKITGIFNQNDEKIECDKYYGDGKLLPLINEYIGKELDALVANGTRKVVINRDYNLSFDLYMCHYSFNSNNYITATVTSSYYFDVERFKHLSDFIFRIFTSDRKIQYPLEIDFFDILSNEINEYIIKNIADNFKVTAYIIIFKSIEKIFESSVLSTFLNVSTTVFNTLKENYKGNSKVLSISLTRFLVLTAVPDGDISEEAEFPSPKDISFTYYDLPVPFNSLKLTFDEYTSIYNLWEKILLLNNYVETGDTPA